jgi:hypothetical protein
MAWGFRSDLAGGLYTLLTGFQAANSGMLDGAFRSRPKHFGTRPLAYVGSRNEALEHTVGIHRRTVTPTVVIVYAAKDYSEEMADVRDDVVDAFLEYASDRPHAISNTTLVEPRATEDVELEIDGAFYPATVITFLAVQQVGAQTGA